MVAIPLDAPAAAPSADAAWGQGWRTAAAERVAIDTTAEYWRFFVGQAAAQKAATRIVGILEAEGLPYAVIGALALNEYGHRRVTVDVHLVMREDDLQTFRAKWLGQGYAERSGGGGKLIDTEHGVHVNVLSTGRFPGDDKPKPIAFPDPALTAVRGKPFAMLPMPMWVELKLASGMVAAHRGKDLVDVQELVRSGGLPASFREELHPWVRERFDVVWALAQLRSLFEGGRAATCQVY